MEERLRKSLEVFLGQELAQSAALENLGGHASLRIYWRVTLPQPVTSRGEKTIMAMVLPEDFVPGASEEGPGGQETVELPFVDVQRYLSGLGLRVPAIDLVDMGHGVLLLEDLGDETFEEAFLGFDDRSRQLALYREAIDLLVDAQKAFDQDRVQSSVAYTRRFDRELLSWEMDHFLEWGIEAQHGKVQEGDDVRSQAFAQAADEFSKIVDALLALPTTLCLRDYQSRNIMRKNGQWVLIDFQDALVGPYVYDLVALLRDSYIELRREEVVELVAYYAQRCRSAGLFLDAIDDVQAAFDLQTLQRKLKDAGRFIYIDRVKKNPSFLNYYEPSLGYVSDALESRPQLRQALQTLEPRFPQ